MQAMASRHAAELKLHQTLRPRADKKHNIDHDARNCADARSQGVHDGKKSSPTRRAGVDFLKALGR